MSRRLTLAQTRPAILLAALFAALLPPLALADASERRLDVQAQAQLEVAPDRATLSARLWEHTPARPRHTAGDPGALRDARERLEARATRLLQALDAAGIPRDAIQAGSLSIRPEHLPTPRAQEDAEPLIRTRLERPLRIETAELERVPELLAALTEADVDALDGVSYDLADRNAARDAALVMALEKARHKARLMADTLGVRLGEVISISETGAPPFAPHRMAMSADRAEGMAAVDYRPGNLTIDAGVSVSWTLEE